MTVERFDALDAPVAAEALRRCCGSTAWVERMVAARPHRSREALLGAADRIWRALEPSDWHEAFAAHPRIGERVAAGWAQEEQAGTRTAATGTLDRFAEANREYEARFGHIFIVCASGKSADEMLRLLESRLGNDAGAELQIAAEEQRQITRLRLQRLLDE